jgi:hypothetical protein
VNPAFGQRRAELAAARRQQRRLVQVQHQPDERLGELLALGQGVPGQRGHQGRLGLSERRPQPAGRLLGPAGEGQAGDEQALQLVQGDVVGRVGAVDRPSGPGGRRRCDVRG